MKLLIGGIFIYALYYYGKKSSYESRYHIFILLSHSNYLEPIPHLLSLPNYVYTLSEQTLLQ